jgi:hypothetical protein
MRRGSLGGKNFWKLPPIDDSQNFGGLNGMSARLSGLCS